jgi:hypothetical protein
MKKMMIETKNRNKTKKKIPKKKKVFVCLFVKKRKGK